MSGSTVGSLFGGSSSSNSGSSNTAIQPMFNTTAGNVPNPNYARPMGSAEQGKEQGSEMPLKATAGIQAKVTDANSVDAARDNKSTQGPDAAQSWGNRLSHYLDYSTRSLG